MNAQEIIDFIASAEKKTPVKAYVRLKEGASAEWGDARVYGGPEGVVVFGDWSELSCALETNADAIEYFDLENDCRNSAVPLLDLKGVNARIEPGAIIRDRVQIGDAAVSIIMLILFFIF